jgi:hypothetical protein
MVFSGARIEVNKDGDLDVCVYSKEGPEVQTSISSSTEKTFTVNSFSKAVAIIDRAMNNFDELKP